MVTCPVLHLCGPPALSACSWLILPLHLPNSWFTLLTLLLLSQSSHFSSSFSVFFPPWFVVLSHATSSSCSSRRRSRISLSLHSRAASLPGRRARIWYRSQGFKSSRSPGSGLTGHLDCVIWCLWPKVNHLLECSRAFLLLELSLSLSLRPADFVLSILENCLTLFQPFDSRLRGKSASNSGY